MIHGVEMSYRRGCRCDLCAHARFVAVKRRLARRRTGDVLVDAAPAVRHLEALCAEGFGMDPMLALAGWGVGRALRGYDRIHLRHAAAVLALSRDRLLAELPDRAHVPSIGSVRRIRSLQAIGWTYNSIIPVVAGNVIAQSSPWLFAKTHRAVAARFNELCMKIGPNRRVAEHSDGVTPLMWDDIDDPAAVPSGRRRAGGWSAVDPDDITLLLDSGYSVDGIADRLGVQYESLYKQLRRMGRDDVKDRLIAARRAS